MTIRFGGRDLDEILFQSYQFGDLDMDDDTVSHLENAEIVYKSLLASLLTIQPGRERDLAVNKLEESFMYCQKAIILGRKRESRYE